MKKILFILFVFLTGFRALAQTDSITTGQVEDSLPSAFKPENKPVKKRVVIDTLKKRSIADSGKIRDSTINKNLSDSQNIDSPQLSRLDTQTMASAIVSPVKPIDTFYKKLLKNPYFKTGGKPIYLVVNERARTGKDEMFYLLAGLLFFLACIKLLFSRYFHNIFRLFFQPAFRQKQTREQLLQNNLPSLLLNLFFVLSCGAYVSLLLSYYHITNIRFWQLYLYSASSLLILYSSKFIFLSFAGWVFNVKEATEPYIFTVYLINKILGVIIVPFTLIIAFSQFYIINISITVSLLVVLLLYIYRYLVSYSPVRKGIKVSILHFLFCIFAFEITPLLLIYKTLIIYLDKSL